MEFDGRISFGRRSQLIDKQLTKPLPLTTVLLSTPGIPNSRTLVSAASAASLPASATIKSGLITLATLCGFDHFQKPARAPTTRVQPLVPSGGRDQDVKREKGLR